LLALCTLCHSAEHGREAPLAALKPIAGRGNLVRQAIGMLVHFPEAARAVEWPNGLEEIDRSGIPLLVELLVQLREDPPPNTAALLDRWRERPDYGPLSKLASGECLVPDAAAAAADLRQALDRLQAEHRLTRLHNLEQKARESPLTAEEKADLLSLLSALRPRISDTRADIGRR
jgi:DNA primase